MSWLSRIRVPVPRETNAIFALAFQANPGRRFCKFEPRECPPPVVPGNHPNTSLEHICLNTVRMVFVSRETN